MGKQEDTQQQQNSFFKSKFISKQHNGMNQSPISTDQQTSALQRFRLAQQPKQFQDENQIPARNKAHNQIRKPFMDITNQDVSVCSPSSAKKMTLKTAASVAATTMVAEATIPQSVSANGNQDSSDISKSTKHFTFLTFLDNTALKQFKVCLFVDKELNIPTEYSLKLQDHTIDNDVATDDEQIQSATRKLRTALEEEVFMQRELEENLLESVMYEEVERYESQIKKQPLEQLFDKIFMAYQSTASKPFILKAHERLLYKTIEKSTQKYREAFKNNTQHYQAYLKKQKNLQDKSLQGQGFQLSNTNTSEYDINNSSDNLLDSL